MWNVLQQNNNNNNTTGLKGLRNIEGKYKHGGIARHKPVQLI